jgi:scyllo-inositol 2-dehydrogenase (NADP+)
VTSDEAHELIAISESQNVVLSVFHNRRWDNGTLALESLLRDRTIGAPTVCSLRFDRFVPEVRDRWREQALPGSGTLYDLGSHLLFAALTLFGMPESLYADLAIQRPGGVVHDFFDISLTYDTLRVQLRSSLLMRSNDLVIEGHGEKGSFVKYGMDPQEAMLKAGLTPGMDAWNDHESDNTYSLTIVDQGTEIQGVPSGTYAEFYAGVADAILDGSPPPISAGQARDCISLIEKSLESAKSGQRITL